MARPNTETRLAAEMIRKRVAHGDHAAYALPSERQLAIELGVSRLTMRKAVQILIEEGVLRKTDKGRLELDQASASRPETIIGFFRPATLSYDAEMWMEGVYGALEGYNVVIRSMTYQHLGESVIGNALDGFDGLFFLPPALDLPEWLADRMRTARARVVVLDQDASEKGLRSVVVFPPLAELALLEHLHRLGHRRIDCINVQPQDPVIQARIRIWREFIDRHRLEGQLLSLTELKRFEASHQLITSRLRDGLPLGSALFCTTVAGALGAMRALKENGLQVGTDISLCAVNDGGLGPYLNPSLTSLRSPARATYLRKAVAWMLRKEEWETPLLVMPEDVPLFLGESTGPAPGTPK